MVGGGTRWAAEGAGSNCTNAPIAGPWS